MPKSAIGRIRHDTLGRLAEPDKQDHAMIAVTERKCVEGKFTLRMSATEFATPADAKRYMDYLEEIPAGRSLPTSSTYMTGNSYVTRRVLAAGGPPHPQKTSQIWIIAPTLHTSPTAISNPWSIQKHFDSSNW